MTWAGLQQSELLFVNSEGVPHPDANYQGWYYRPYSRDEAWEYYRIRSTGEFEVHHFCNDTCSVENTSPLGSQLFCCSSLTAGGERCNAGSKRLYIEKFQ